MPYPNQSAEPGCSREIEEPGHQSQDRQGSRVDDTSDSARSRRRGHRMRRRDLIALVGGTAILLPGLSHAQPTKTHVIGMLDYRSAASAVSGTNLNVFRDGLRELGYGEYDITIESRFAEFHAERLPHLAGGVVGVGPEATVTSGTTPARAPKQATPSTPI